MQHSEQFAQVAGALALAQGVFPPIVKSKSVVVKIKSRDGQPAGSYTFKYAPLESILAAVRPGLSGNGLALVQAVMLDDSNVETLRTTLIHSSGEWLANETPVFSGTGDNKSQAWASGSSYSRRYGVSMLLCVSSDEDADDDGNGGDTSGRTPDYVREQTPRPRGSFPKQGGGRSSPPARDEPRTPAELPLETAEAAPVVHDAAAGAWGPDLADGPRRLLNAKAKAAGLSEAEVFERFGTTGMAQLNTTLAGLQTLADEAFGG